MYEESVEKGSLWDVKMVVGSYLGHHAFFPPSNRVPLHFLILLYWLYCSSSSSPERKVESASILVFYSKTWVVFALWNAEVTMGLGVMAIGIAGSASTHIKAEVGVDNSY